MFGFQLPALKWFLLVFVLRCMIEREHRQGRLAMKPFRVCLRTKQIAPLRELANRQKIAIAELIILLVPHWHWQKKALRS
jgi:hypothetical protein